MSLSERGEANRRTIRVCLVTSVSEGPVPTHVTTDLHDRILYHFLYHPLVRELGDVEIVSIQGGTDGEIRGLGLSEAFAAKPELIVVGHGETTLLTPETLAELERYLGDGGACLWAQPVDEQERMPAAVEELLGAQFEGWTSETPQFSTVAAHPVARAIGRSVGETLYPHRAYWRSMHLRATDADVAAYLGGGVWPDLLLSRRAKLAVFATDVFSDVMIYYRHPDYDAYHDRLGTLVANTIRHLLGAPVTEPLLANVTDLVPVFYAAGFAVKTYEQVAEAAGVAVDPAAIEFAREESHFAAVALLAGRPGEAEERCGWICKRMGEAIDEIAATPRYFVRGWHGGVAYPEIGPEGVLGYAEWGWPDWTAAWMQRHVDWIERFGGKRLNEVPGQTWDALAAVSAPVVEQTRQAIARGSVETVRAAWSHAYFATVGEESNVRQLTFGKRAVAEVLGEDVKTFLCAYDHYDFHPQLPQLLLQNGYDNVVMRCGGPGILPEVPEALINWEGEDGSTILTAPNHGAPMTFQLMPGQMVNDLPAAIVEGGRSGISSLLMGGSQDATMDYVCEREHTIANALGPVDARHVSTAEYFAEQSQPEATIRFGVDELIAKPASWSGYGSIAEAARRDRALEARLIDADALGALAWAAENDGELVSLDDAWKALLSSQDHFIYGCGMGANPEGYHVGGLLYPHMENYPGPRTPIALETYAAGDLAKADEATQRAIDGYVERLAANIDTTGLLAPTLVVINPTAWARTEAAEAKVEFDEGAIVNPALHDGNERLPVQLLNAERYGDGSLRSATLVFAPRLPALGYRVFELVEAADEPAATTEGCTIENETYRVRVDERTGIVTEIFDKRLGRDLVTADGANIVEYGFPSVVRAADGVASVRLTESGPVRQRVTVTGTVGKYPFEAAVTLTAGVERVDFDLSVDCGAGAIFGLKGEPQTLFKSRFPLAIEGTPVVHQPFGIYETKREEQAVLDFAAIRGEEATVVLSRLGIPGSLQSTNELALILGDGMPPVRGVHLFTYSLFALPAANASQAEIMRRARSRSHAVYVGQTGSHAGELPRTGSLLAVDGPFVAVSSMVDEGAISVRLLNASDEPAPLAGIQTPGETLGPIESGDRALRPWEIASVRWGRR
jgi:hypothetical protein